jgi:hypothetical protein
MICPKCGAEIDGLYLNGCFKCLIKPPSDVGRIKASDSLKESETRDASKKTTQGDWMSTNKVRRQSS